MIHIKTKIITTNYFVELDGKNKRNISISVLKFVLYFNVKKSNLLPHACSITSDTVQLLATLWTIARQAPLSNGFSRQEY